MYHPTRAADNRRQLVQPLPLKAVPQHLLVLLCGGGAGSSVHGKPPRALQHCAVTVVPVHRSAQCTTTKERLSRSERCYLFFQLFPARDPPAQPARRPAAPRSAARRSRGGGHARRPLACSRRARSEPSRASFRAVRARFIFRAGPRARDRVRRNCSRAWRPAPPRPGSFRGFS